MNLSKGEFSISYKGQTQRLTNQKEKDRLRREINADIEVFLKKGGIIQKAKTQKSKWSSYKKYGRNTYALIMEKKKNG